MTKTTPFTTPYIMTYKAMIKAIPYYHTVKQVRETMKEKADYYTEMANSFETAELKEWAKNVARVARAISTECILVETIEDLVLNCQIAMTRYELLLV